MAVKNFPNVSPDANPSFTLESNTSSFESSLNKNVQHMELPGARWRGSVAFSNRTRQEANKIKAFMTSLGGQVGRFYLTPFDAYQSGTMSGTGAVDGAVASGVSSIPTKGWEADQDTLFEAGDYIEVNGELKMVTDDVAGSDYIEYAGTNYMPSPFDPDGWQGASDSDVNYTKITESNPSGEPTVGLFEYLGPGTPPICQTLNNSISIGEKSYVAILAKGISGTELGLRIAFQENVTTFSNVRVNVQNGASSVSGGISNVLVTDMPDGWKLIQIENTSENNVVSDFDIYVQFYKIGENGSQIGFPSVGDSIKCQATYFGKSDRYKGAISYTGTNLMPSPFDPSGWSGASDPDLSYTNVTIGNPSGESFTGEFEALVSTFCQINTLNYINSPPNGFYYTCFIIKEIAGIDLGVRVITRSTTTQLDNSYVNLSTLNTSTTAGAEFNNIDLGSGWKLIQIKLDIQSSEATLRSEIYLWDVNPSGTATGFPTVGDTVQCQAAFFGKADDYPAVIDPADPNQYPANLLATADVPIAPPLRKALTGGESIITNEPKGKFYLGSNDQNWDINVNGVQSMGFDFIEDVN